MFAMIVGYPFSCNVDARREAHMWILSTTKTFEQIIAISFGLEVAISISCSVAILMLDI